MTESVYLAGPITGLPYWAAMDWREEAADRLTSLGYDVFSPMREKMYLQEEFGENPLPHTHHTFADPYPRDKQDIKRADYLLINLVPSEEHDIGPSVGTLVEMGIAEALGKFIIVVTKEDPVHPFIRGPADLLFTDIEMAYTWLEHMLPLTAGRFRRRLLPLEFENVGDVLQEDGTWWLDGNLVPEDFAEAAQTARA